MNTGKEEQIFEAQCTAFWQEQMQSAEGQRRENIMEKFAGTPFRRADVEAWLWMKPDACSRLLHGMEKAGLVARVAGGKHRAHAYELTEKAWSFTVFGGAIGWDRGKR